MAQNNDIAKPVRRYTRVDFAALRAFLNGVQLDLLVDRYYSEDDMLDRGWESARDVHSWLEVMSQDMADRALKTYPTIAGILADSRRSGRWSKPVIDFLTVNAEKDLSRPFPTDSISVWFKPRLADALKGVGLASLADLKRYIESAGLGWWRPIPRVGAGKARVIEHWLTQNSQFIGALTLEASLPAVTNQVTVGMDTGLPVPLERIGGITPTLNGSQGRNRNTSFCLISARNDLEAIQAYLYRFRGREKTLRSYRKELERFLLWCVLERRVAMSSVLTDECEAYKNFIADIPADWCGKNPQIPRLSQRWRPFAGQLQPESQRYAIQAIRTFFEWLVDVRYLLGNPWKTVADPSTIHREMPMQIEKALPQQLWEELANQGGLLDRVCDGEIFNAIRRPKTSSLPAQFRLARAAILLIGFTGIRREEAARATRNKLKPVPGRNLWQLTVVGKRNKERTVFFPPRVIDALKAHWLDRGHDFSDPHQELALIAPIVIAPTRSACAKHEVEGDDILSGRGFAPDSLGRLVKSSLLRLADDHEAPISPEERHLLRSVAPHALRHTFATVSTAKQMPPDVLQQLLGHASLTTTSIYVHAQRQRSLDEVAKLYKG
ncbi:tyrosine recombinase XerD [Novimethylophilus kurashikiensis]|uniref:Tyrosine recombinase XerD n=1 Tax=Novimethylophilus kurashikiensis TaxID=1825523 RepID=A0A2R5FCX5_9PROT|nr:phage integrase family protein [Novimethylophilus kurashikiensis]GBG14494.1 tyrosine recombinase XerD [Novimethylophilus kurashikiensis]